MGHNAVEVEGLIKNFGNLKALDGISFEIPEGTIFGLLGPNGAGKTTAVRILSTILKPDGGRAEVMGHDVCRDANAVRHQIGLAGQAAAVDPNLTGRENLRMVGILAQLPRREAKQRADELLERFGLVDAADRTLGGYSGGMRRRLDVAAALVARPPVLFLDEPTTGLDVQSRTELWEVIRELVADGATVLLTTQYLEEADKLANRIAVVDHGHVIANDTASGLKAKLGGTVIELGMETEQLGREAEAIVGRIVRDSLVREGSLIRFSSVEGPRLLVDVLRKLDAAGLEPHSLSVGEPSLDDVFLALTGHHPANGVPGSNGARPEEPEAEEPVLDDEDEYAADAAVVAEAIVLPEPAPATRKPRPAKPRTPAKKPASAPRKRAAKPAARKAAAKKTTAKKPAAKKTASRKTGARNTIAPGKTVEMKGGKIQIK